MTETSGPRGRISLIKAVDEGRLDVLSPGFVHQMSECLDCRACAAACPSGVEYGQLVEGARARIEEAQAPRRGLAARIGRRLALRSLFGSMMLMRVVAVLLRFYQRSGLQALVHKSGVPARLGLADAEASAPHVSDAFFAAHGQRFSGRGPRQHTVMLHAGCIMHVAFAEVDRATVRVLTRNGCDVTVPRGQGCCGAIAVHAGDVAFARRLAKRNIEAFERSGADTYVVNAAGCGSALKEYAELFADDAEWRDRAVAFSSCVRDVLEFLDENGAKPGTRVEAGRVAYQDACHLAHAQRVAAAPRRLLKDVAGVDLCALPESAVCCGSAGIYSLTQPEMSRKLRDRKVRAIAESGAHIVATANPGCALQMRAGLAAAGMDVQVKHVVELLDDAYASAALQ